VGLRISHVPFSTENDDVNMPPVAQAQGNIQLGLQNLEQFINPLQIKIAATRVMYAA